MERQCEFCGRSFVAKRSTARFCSGACKLKFSRGQTPPKKVVKIAPAPKPMEENPVGYTPTDMAFEKYRPGYYIFDKELYSRDCFSCGKKFETHLEMTKFCSPDCKNLLLSKFSFKGSK